MTFRLTVLIAIVLIAPACSSSSAPVITSTTAVVIADATATEACLLEATIAEAPFTAALGNESVQTGKPVTWTVTVTNTGATPGPFYLVAGRQVDVILRTAAGVDVYQWSTGRTFQDGARCRVVPAGGVETLPMLDETFRVPAGTYTAEVIVAGAPNPTSSPQTVTVTSG